MTSALLQSTTQQNPINGWVVIDKPLYVSSTAITNKIRKLCGAKKAGHAGTLDPLASGVLPIAIGEATKTIPYFMDSQKSYQFTVEWGETRSTDDAEGTVTSQSQDRPSFSEIEAILPHFTGVIEQTPPAFSAIKIQGKRAYELARSGQEFSIKKRNITINTLTILSHEENRTQFSTTCSKGTYIRSLARDMGNMLGCGGYISALERTKVGLFTLNDAILVEKFKKIVHTDELNLWLYPVDKVLDDIPALILDQQQTMLVRQGQSLPHLAEYEDGQVIRTYFNDTLIALCIVKEQRLQPKRVFNLD